MATKYLALDIGRRRIGVAVANSVARIAAPLPAVENNATAPQTIAQLVSSESVDTVVAGLPRGLNGQETEQTAYVRQFVAELGSTISKDIALIDEAVTSVQAEAELSARGKTFSKGDIDSLSAVYILEDYMNQEVTHA